MYQRLTPHLVEERTSRRISKKIIIGNKLINLPNTHPVLTKRSQLSQALLLQQALDHHPQ